MGQKFNPYLAGQLLLAMPHMNDPRFHKAAVLICAHDDKGAMGIVMNHTLPDLEFGQILKDLDIQSTITLPDAVSKLPVMCGGPVEIARGFLVHSNDFKHNGTIEVNESVRITATVDAIKALSDGTK
ncbi:MAG: YqgE/AlgH family protein, partial [Pseudomonadota bacterium]